MSSQAFLIYYGVKLMIESDREIEMLELGTDDRIRRAVTANLSYYWGNFSVDERVCVYLFIGAEIGIFGAEGLYEISLSESDLLELMRRTRERLESAGFHEAPMLVAQWEPDY